MTATAGVVFYFDWEMRFMEWLQAHVGSSGFGFWLLSNLSAFGEQLLLVAIMGFLYWGLNKEFGKYVGLNVLMVNVWNPMIKNIVLRLRPYFVPGYNVKLLRLIDESADTMDIAAQGYSFPSGHSANAVTVYGSLAAHEKKRKLLWVLAVVLPLLVGFSRVFVGAHYPTDVLCGWLLGVIIVALIPWLRRAIRNRWLFYAVLLLSALPGFFFCTSNDYYSSFGMLLGFVLAEPFEEKYVKFENTSNIFRCILRTLDGGLIYFGLNEVLKLPFPKELLSAGNLVSQLIRMLRYAVVIFVVIGVYPLLFKLTGKLWSRSGQKRKAYSVMLVLVLCLSLLAPAQAAAQSDDTRSAIATNNTIVVSNSTDQPDAHVVHPAVYKIEGENYFKLRDLAMLLIGSAKQFAVDYVDAAKPVSITSGKPYEAIGGELSGVAAETTSANISNDAIDRWQSRVPDGF